MKFDRKFVELNAGMEPGIILYKRSGEGLGTQDVDYYKSFDLYTSADTLELHPSTLRKLEERHARFGGR